MHGDRPAWRPTPPLLFVSTHLDDVVLSCAGLLERHPGSTVVTVLAGAPDRDHDGYNRLSTGKVYAPDAVRVRREEDEAALSSLGATPRWLDFLDGDFLGAPSRTDQAEIAEQLGRTLAASGAGAVFAPLGIVHPDHVGVADACRALTETVPTEWYLYADMPYMQDDPGAVGARLAELDGSTALEELEPVPADAGRKDHLARLYATQYPWIGGAEDGFASKLGTPERYWRVLR
jgi:LmbE family N-acetylglucosaminyl deacetylase